MRLSLPVACLTLLFLDGIAEGRHIRDANQVCNTDVCKEATKSMLGAMDASIDPCTNFYNYACGNYVKTHPIPSDRNSIGRFGDAADSLSKQIKDILEGNENDEIPEMVKVKRLFQACLNAKDAIDEVRAQVDKFGGSPLFTGPNWDPAGFDIFGNLAYFFHVGIASIFGIAVSHDQKRPLTNVIVVDQGTINTDRDYFLEDGYASVLDNYRAYVDNMTKVLFPGENPDKETMLEELIDFETDLANLTSTPLERQDSTRMYNRMTIEELQQATDPEKKFINWTEFIKSIIGVEDITEQEPIIVQEVDYLINVTKMLMTTDKRIIANYMIWSYLANAADEAFGVLRAAKRDFMTSLGGATSDGDRVKQCSNTAESVFGFVLGRAYAKKYFSEQDKKEADEMIEILQNAFIERLQSVEFMDQETKTIAADKAKSIMRLIGYPDWILNDTALIAYYKNYPDMTESHFQNALGAAEASAMDENMRLREKIDRTRFLISPVAVNAIYVATVNAITIPIAMLQPPFYQAGLPAANNFGAIGAIIGHEITHGFDNDGRKYDKFGAMKDWWPQEVVQEFEDSTTCFVDQYAKYCQGGLIPQNKNLTVCVNGETTLGENIADNGGLAEAYQAYKHYIEKNGPDSQLPGMGNFTWDQIFFLSYANVWCESYTSIGYQTQVLTDEHSPENFRVIGAVSNSPDFAKAFNCPVGEMNRGDKRCNIW